jgi:hypothetical protein
VTTSEILKNVPTSSVKQETFTLFTNEASPTVTIPTELLLKFKVTEESVNETIAL